MLIRYLAAFLLVLLSLSQASAEDAGSSNSTNPEMKNVAFDPLVAVSNFNQFKTNLDRAQEFLLNIWQGAYGGIGILWLIWSWWLVAGGFYYSFANVYLKAKDEAEAESEALWKENTIDTNARFLRQIDVTNIFSNIKSVHEKVTNRLGDACYERGLCEMRSFFATTPFYNMIPKKIRKWLKLEALSREDGTCGEIYSSCSFQNLLLSLLQGYFPGSVG